jgi:lambda repressor-like predicted transcriptional regulator
MATRTRLGNGSSRSFITRAVSLRQLSFKHDYESNTLVHARDRQYRRAEAIIAKALGVKRSAIWLSRYERRRRRKRAG